MFLLEPSIFIWDLIILSILCTTFCGAITCYCWSKRNTKRVIAKRGIQLLGYTACFAFFAMFYAAFIEPQRIVVHKESIHLPLRSPLKIAVIGDQHLGPTKGRAYTKKLVQAINNTFPDIVLLTGDYMFDTHSNIDGLLELQHISAPLGVFGVLGNHDQGQYKRLFEGRYSIPSDEDYVEGMLLRANVTVLRNENVILTSGDDTIAIAGIDDLWTANYDVHTALKNIYSNVPIILLSHNPSIIKKEEASTASLVVSGHTHGGQVRLPFIGPLTNLPTSIGNAYDKGIFSISDTQILAITSGAGESTARFRFWDPPEILLLTAQPK